MRGGGSLLHQCPDSSPAAYNPVSFDIVTVVSCWARLTFPHLGRWPIPPFKNSFPLSDWWWGVSQGLDAAMSLQTFSARQGGEVSGWSRLEIDNCLTSIKMCPGSNIFQLFPRTGAGKQVGGFWELGGRLGGTGFKGSSGNLAMGLLIGGSPNMSIHILKKVTKLAFGAKSVVIWALSLNNRV